jgi:hypothetical protein
MEIIKSILIYFIFSPGVLITVSSVYTQILKYMVYIGMLFYIGVRFYVLL